mgnify:FL=1
MTDATTGTPQCMPTYAPYPEICNGLDDDCDGTTDMMSVSWSNPQFANYSLPPEHAGLDCNQINVCRCADGATETHDGTSWATFLDSWEGVCQCGESLEAEYTPAATPAASGADDLSPSACSAVSRGTVPASLLALVALGLMVLVRRTRDA